MNCAERKDLILLYAFDQLEPAEETSLAAHLREGCPRCVGELAAARATSGLVAAPCGAPAFAAVLTWVATTQSAVLGFIYLFVFALGMTAVLVVVGLFSGAIAALPRAGAWIAWIKKAAGVVLLLMAEYYFVKAGQVW